MFFFSDVAILLKKIPYHNRWIVTGLTYQSGLISCVSPPRSGASSFLKSLDVFSASEWMWKKKSQESSSLGSLYSLHLRESFESFPRSLTKIQLASFCSELILKTIPENNPCPEVFLGLAHAFHLLNQFQVSEDNWKGKNYEFLSTYLGKVLCWSGYFPELFFCAFCQKTLESSVNQKEKIFLEGTHPFWVCESCAVNQKKKNSFGSLACFVSADLIGDFSEKLKKNIHSLFSQEERGDEWKVFFQWLWSIASFHLPGCDPSSFKSLSCLMR